MAYNPGILTHWPWEALGNFKYALVAPGIVHSTYLFLVKGEETSLFYFLVFPFALLRVLHYQIWISYSRFRTAKGKNLIVDRSINFEQVDRERNWDDQILLNWIILYGVNWGLKLARQAPFWRLDGLIQIFVLHIGLVEFLYYWLHRALHHHFLYSRYHSHHHSSVVTEPMTSVTHPFVEELAYFVLFSIPLLVTLFAGTNSIVAAAIYMTYIDFMNNMGHCNFEVIPKWVFDVFPALKYLMYTPSYHSLHHTHFRTNYSLFVPFYDYIYGTMDESTHYVYETSLKKPEDVADVVHLTHLTTPQSLYHLRLGFASLASNPMNYKWYLWLMWPVTLWSYLMTWVLGGQTFVVETNTFQEIKSQSWVVPRYKKQYLLKWQREAINKLIEEAILEADDKGIKVVSLGLLNQGKLLNKNGEIYLERHPKLRVKIVDGSSLSVALVLNSIPKTTSKVLFRGTLSKVAYSIVSTLCHNGVQVATIRKDEHEKLKKNLAKEDASNLILFTVKHFDQYKVWLVGEDLTKDEQLLASKGTLFIQFSQFPPNKVRKDCFYINAPAMFAPKSLGNLHSCENWLPRRVMSASRVAGIVHALEGWNTNECGDELFDKDKVWEASIQHGFRPFLSQLALS